MSTWNRHAAHTAPQTKLVDGVAIVVWNTLRLCGREAERLAANLMDHLPLARRVLLDLRSVRQIDGTGLRALTEVARGCREAGLDFAVCEPAPAVRRMLAAVGLHTQVDVFSNQQQALQTLCTEAA